MAETIIVGYRTPTDLKAGVAKYQTEGYTTVACGPTDSAKFTLDKVTRWPAVADKKLYILIATTDKIEPPATKP
jgi:hypothetical protein